MQSRILGRRGLLKALGGASIALPFYRLLGGSTAKAAPSTFAKRVIFFYFPDGIPGKSQAGEPSAWEIAGGETGFTLPDALADLNAHKDKCVFFQGLSMGPTDSGSHPGGAKKLLTATDEGNDVSIDQLLARSVGASSPVPHLYLGAMATQNNPSGDKFISYPSPGTTIAPEDDPRRAFARLFGSGVPSGGGGTSAGGAPDPVQVGVIDAVLGDMNDLRGRLGNVEKTKLDLHLDALHDLEKRIKALPTPTGPSATCGTPNLDLNGVDDKSLYDPAAFPQILRAQIDLTVAAMACDLTKVGVIQCAQHTSDLVMSRFVGTEMYDPAHDMRSHQASHYGDRHDPTRDLYLAFSRQTKWWVKQYAYLLDQLAQRPEGNGTMLDNSIVVLCTEISDGNTHSHDEMPFILGGGGGGAIRSGRYLKLGYHRHADLLLAIGQAMGANVTQFGQESAGPLPGLLSG